MLSICALLFVIILMCVLSLVRRCTVWMVGTDDSPYPVLLDNIDSKVVHCDPTFLPAAAAR